METIGTPIKPVMRAKTPIQSNIDVGITLGPESQTVCDTRAEVGQNVITAHNTISKL